MFDKQSEQLEQRVLVLAPTARDAQTSGEILEAAGLPYELCDTIDCVCHEQERGAGAAVVGNQQKC